MKKKIKFGITKTGGRNNQGIICNYNKGGGHKRLYRIIDFKKNDYGTYKVKSIEYDPNRSSNIALIQNIKTLKKYYILASQNLKIDQIIHYTNNLNYIVKCYEGNSHFLKDIPVGTIIHNVEITPKKGGQLARSAGTYVKIINKNLYQNKALIKLPSKQSIYISLNCKGTIGRLSNIKHKFQKLRKAGQSRWLNKRPTVRGVAMNPIDHPHGGGEGKSSGGRISVSPWGKYTKGYKTCRKLKK